MRDLATLPDLPIYDTPFPSRIGFVSGTLIATRMGDRKVEDLVGGDDAPMTHDTKWRRLQSMSEREVPETFELVASDYTVVVGAAQLFLASRSWVPAHQLERGGIITLARRQPAPGYFIAWQLFDTRLYQVRRVEAPARTYGLHFAKDQVDTFFAGGFLTRELTSPTT